MNESDVLFGSSHIAACEACIGVRGILKSSRPRREDGLRIAPLSESFRIGAVCVVGFSLSLMPEETDDRKVSLLVGEETLCEVTDG